MEEIFKSAKATEFHLGEVAQTFLKYGVENAFGAVLLYNRFSPAYRKTVNFGEAAVPWDASSNSEELWLLVPGTLQTMDWTHMNYSRRTRYRQDTAATRFLDRT